MSLPELVECMIDRICAEKSVTPPDHLARQVLDRLGESESLNILGVIASSSTVYNFSGFIMFLAKKSQSPIAMAHNAEGLSTRQSGCLLGPLDRGDLFLLD